MTGHGREQKGVLATAWPQRCWLATLIGGTIVAARFLVVAWMAHLATSPALMAAPALRHDVEARVVVREDRTFRAEQTVRTHIQSEQGLASASVASIAYTEGLETLLVQSAVVLRSDGSTTEVDLRTLQRRTAAPGQHLDARTAVLAFPSLAVGDTIVYTTVRQTLVTAFEGHFSYAWTFSRSQPWARARHTIVAPVSMALNVDVSDGTTGLSYSRVDADGTSGVVEHVFTFEPAHDEVPEEAGAVSPSDRDPSFTITTFSDHAAFATAYWRMAQPNIAVTDEIRSLAAEIARGLTTPIEKVTAIDRWIKRNIRYVAAYLGRDRWVPQAASRILKAHAGDCKDHAVLMSALLDAVGVESEHVLVNLGTAYSLPKLPPAAFNHVMLHVPEAKLMLDPSAPLSATGILALQAYDKPALFVNATGARVGRTERMSAGDHTTTARTTIAVASNGALNGETVQTATGIFASSARVAALRFHSEGAARAAEFRLAALGTPGSGTFDATSPSELREPYVVTATFSLSDLAELPLAGNRRLPVGLPVHARPGQFLLGPRIAGRKWPFICLAGTQTEVITLTFADGLALPRVPQGKKIATSVFSFEARYTLNGRTFTATRVFTSTVGGQVCPATLEASLAEPLKEVLATLGTMLAFPPGSGAKKRL